MYRYSIYIKSYLNSFKILVVETSLIISQVMSFPRYSLHHRSYLLQFEVFPVVMTFCNWMAELLNMVLYFLFHSLLHNSEFSPKTEGTSENVFADCGGYVKNIVRVEEACMWLHFLWKSIAYVEVGCIPVFSYLLNLRVYVSTCF